MKAAAPTSRRADRRLRRLMAPASVYTSASLTSEASAKCPPSTRLLQAPGDGPTLGATVNPGYLVAICLTRFSFLQLCLASSAVAIAVIGKLSMAKESDLKFVAGSVQRAPRWVSTKGGSIIVIRVKTDDGLHDLDEQDLSHSREIMHLRPGDRITARVKFWGGDHNIWELKRDGVTIESYQDTYLYQAAMNKDGATAALCVRFSGFNISDGGPRSKNVFRGMAGFNCLGSSGRSRLCPRGDPLPAAEFRRLPAHLLHVSGPGSSYAARWAHPDRPRHLSFMVRDADVSSMLPGILLHHFRDNSDPARPQISCSPVCRQH